MGLLRIQHIYNNKSGLARDGVVNTFYFSGLNPADAAAVTALAPVVQEFYDGAVSPHPNLGSFIATVTMATNRHTIKGYDMLAAPERVPLATITPVPQILNSTTPALPQEVALCLSFRATPQSGMDQARRRGRFYLGPLNTTALTGDLATNMARPVPGLQTAAVQNAKKMQDQASALGWEWVVYSPTTRAFGPGDFYTALVQEVWCDNAFDTQRRRGQAASQRTELTV